MTGRTAAPYTWFPFFRLHASHRASRVIEIARLRNQRSSSRVDPPRRGRPWAPGGPPPPFNQCVLCRGLPPDQASFLKEIERLKVSGVLRSVEYSRWVSCAFLVPTLVGSGWRLIVGLREINAHCQTRKIKIVTLRSLGLIVKLGDHWVTFDLKDGFYSMANDPKD